MNSSQVGVLEERHEVGLSRLLEGHDRRALEPQIGLEVLRNLTDEALEGQLPDKELSALLVPSDFTKGDSSRAETMGLLHTTSGSL